MIFKALKVGMLHLAIHGLLELQKKEDPDILFLFETKMDEWRMQRFRWGLGLVNMVVKNYDGKGGGLALFWRRGVEVNVRAISQLYIDAEVVEKDGFIWRFTGIYGEPKSELKYRMWDAL